MINLIIQVLVQQQQPLLNLQGKSSDAAGSHVVGFNLYGKNTTAQTISATITCRCYNWSRFNWFKRFD